MELYLLRHGQAGLRDDYDRLSDLGQEQVARLAAYWQARGIRFDRILTGGLRRQQESAALVAGAARVEVDPRWSEFDLDAVYAAVAPQLAAVDPEFRRSYEEVLRESQDPEHPVHRSWRPADMAVVQAWVAGRFPLECETWPQFEARVREALAHVEVAPGQRILVATSATPIGISTAGLFGAGLPHAFSLAGAQFNSSYTVFSHRRGRWELTHFNQISHLDEPRLLTLR